ncbi:MAG: sulfite exporter TauE/SafE family protein [Pyrobaculum sp.]
MENVMIIMTMAVLSIVSGMLGLGVAFAAIPFLGLFLHDLVRQVHPLSLLLNGVTALVATVGFAKSGYVDWRKAFTLAAVTTSFAPVGAYLVQYVEQTYVWIVYLMAAIYLTYRLFRPVRKRERNFGLALLLAIPISILSGFLGVGPGFLLMPTLILVGFPPKNAAGINAFAVTPPSFSALIPHLGRAQWDYNLAAPLLVAGAVGSYIGARLTSLYIPSNRVRQLFGILLIVVTSYKIYTLTAV